MTDTVRAMVATAEAAELPRGAGRVDSGPGARYVHLVFLLGGGWATACSADYAGLDGAGEGRHVRSVAELVDCPDCLSSGRSEVAAVNRYVAEQQRQESRERELLAGFLRWASEEYPIDEGGAVLAVYASGTRLHAMRADERAHAIELWLASRRRYLDG
ncbi:hypothetical protein ACIBTV_27490 [Micromonospora sp. NPDC049366]|uniref:hypothetical protein n=1 Tax=Micromonospora sp. NPDC049366 TaxID=3364271 RepID=UPI0037A9FDE5